MAPAQLKKYYERFLEVDRDESGYINYEEFGLVLEEDDSDLLRALFDLFDLDCRGTLEIREFILGLAAHSGTQNAGGSGTSRDERLRFAYLLCDADAAAQSEDGGHGDGGHGGHHPRSPGGASRATGGTTSSGNEGTAGQQGGIGREDVYRILKSNFLAQQASHADLERRVIKVFRTCGIKERDIDKSRLSFEDLLGVSKKVSGLVYPAYALVEDAARGNVASAAAAGPG